MASYAAVISLIHVMENIKMYRLRYPTFLDEQKMQLESLNENLIFLQDFLETYSSQQAAKDETLESRIADVVYAAEDIIETYIVDYLHDIYDKTATNKGRNAAGNLYELFLTACCLKSTASDGRMSSSHFSVELHKLLEGMDFLLKEVMAIEESNQFQVQQQLRDHLVPAAAASLSTNRKKASVELFRDEMNQIVDKLTRGRQPNLLTCSIVGMGGTGKTTLAKLIHENTSVVRRFDIRGWVAVSQQFKLRGLLLGLLRDIKALDSDEGLDDHQLREKLHKHLFGRRYLIVVDDVWDVEALDMLKLSLPDNQNGSRIMVTTRISNVATHSGESSFIHKMNFLDETKSWGLFSDLLFGKETCPPELKEIVQVVAGNCKGLLLALSVLGGLLANSNITHEYLEHIASDTMAIVNSNDEDHCLKILSMSYNNLPVHLKPCFLYLGVFEEDANIFVLELMRLWVSEGLLKPSKVKSMEEVADDYLKDLIGRNLIFVSKFDRMGNMKYCKMHDLVRDLCLREARKERFLYVTKFVDPAAISQDFDSHRRVAIINAFDTDGGYFGQLDFASQSSLSPRSLIWKLGCDLTLPFDVKLLRVLTTTYLSSLGDGYLEGFNLRFICNGGHLVFPNSIHLFWNLQTLYSLYSSNSLYSLFFNYSHSTKVTAPSAIWEIPQLRHVINSGFYLSDPLVEKTEGQDDDIVLENLQVLRTIIDFTCTDEVLRKLPNVKELAVAYRDSKMLSTNCLENLDRLQKLETLHCEFHDDMLWPKPCELIQTLKLPLSLKDLYVYGLHSYWRLCSYWEDMVGKIGSLPHLEQLKLSYCIFEEWETVEGQFLHLKSLKLYDITLVSWKTDSTHFPCLEHLRLKKMLDLEKIPYEIGDIPTLRSIKLSSCIRSVEDSAKRILEEQTSLGNEDLIVTIDGERVCLDGE